MRAFVDRVLRAREGSQNPWLLMAALAAFVVFTVLGIRALPPIDEPIRWELIIAAGVICVPVIVVLNALEFRLMAHFAQHHPPMLEILQVTILGSAANLLPMPGAVMVRIANLKKAGVRVKKGLNLTAIIGLAWLGTAGVLGGLVQLWSHTTFALVALGIGATLLTIGTLMLMRALDAGVRFAGAFELLCIEVGFILMQALRLFLVAAALRFEVSYAQTTTLAIASVAAAAIGFLPSGLGAREGLAAILAPIVGRCRYHRRRPLDLARGPVDPRGHRDVRNPASPPRPGAHDPGEHAFGAHALGERVAVRVLLAEDDVALATVIARGLRRSSLAVDVTHDGEAALDKARVVAYDVVVLDRELPVVHGDEVCRALHEDGSGPRILMLTASGSVEDRVEGLSLGADDYLPKPFAMQELVARVRALGRRARPAQPAILKWNDIWLDPARHTAGRGDVDIRLTNREFAVLEELIASDGALVSAEELMERVWDDKLDPFSNIVRVTILTLRRKLGDPAVIETAPGAGYRLV